MSKRQIEIFSAGCPACDESIELVNKIACSSCEITVLDMHDKAVAQRAKDLGIHRVPAIVVNGKLAECCESKPINEDILRELGVGNPQL